MNKKFLMNWLVLFVAWMAGSFLVHGFLLHDDYAKLPNLFRTETDSQQYMPLMLLAHVIMSGSMVWVHARTKASTSWLMDGLSYGLAVALLAIVPTYIIYFVVQPMPGSLVIKQIVFDGALLVLLGVLLGWLYRDR